MEIIINNIIMFSEVIEKMFWYILLTTATEVNIGNINLFINVKTKKYIYIYIQIYKESKLI